jgi:hypothetical protein
VFLFDAAVHPERISGAGDRQAFADACTALPALGALRVRAGETSPAVAVARLWGLGTARGLTPDVLGLFRRARYLSATAGEVLDAIAALERGDAPTPPPMPDLARYYRDGNGPYLCDLVPAPGKTCADVRARLPGARLWGEPLLREREDAEAPRIARALVLAFAVAGGWVLVRRGRREALARLLAAGATLVLCGILGTGIDRWSVAAFALVVGAPAGGSLLVAAPCLLFPFPALHRMGLILCLGGALRILLRRPTRPALASRRAMVRGGALAIGLGAVLYLALEQAPLYVPIAPEVEAEPGAMLVAPGDVAATAARLRAEGTNVTGDERLLPAPPDPRRQRDLWRIFTRAKSLAGRAEGAMRARFEDVADAASQMSLTTLPRDLRWRLRAADGRAVLWVDAGIDRPGVESARTYRERGERDLRTAARLAGILVAIAAALAGAFTGGGRHVVLRLAGAAVGAAILLLWDPQGADLFLPLVPPTALVLGPALALAAASLAMPGFLWPAAALLLATGFSPGSPRSPSRPSPSS